MKNNFSFLGVGACGGNQVAAFKKYGVNSFYINSALEDLQSLGIIIIWKVQMAATKIEMFLKII